MESGKYTHWDESTHMFRFFLCVSNMSDRKVPNESRERISVVQKLEMKLVKKWMVQRTILTKNAGKTWYIPNKAEMIKVHEARKFFNPPLKVEGCAAT